jgi:16S rRNA (cytosine967-C5)-methyltransferase
MKIHRPLAEAAAQMIRNVLRDKKALEGVMQETFAANPKWGKRDRAFIAGTVFDVIRWRRSLEFVADHASVRAWCAAQWLRMGLDVPDWWTHEGATPGEMLARESALPGQSRALRESIPDWLDELGSSELGPEWDDEIAALNRRAPVFLRVNTLRNDREGAMAWLAEAGVECAPVAGMADALALAAGRTLPKPLLADGRVEVQDAGSQMIAPLLAAQPGECVIDSCAGAGGKTLQLAALMRNEGRIYALDTQPRKLRELTHRARRGRVRIVRTRSLLDAAPDDFAGMADRLLIDAPCSGLGTLRRQPDLKWRLTPAKLEKLRAQQKEILRDHSVMLKPGGRLVYATCSILPSENIRVAESLAHSGGFRIVSSHAISPAATGFDGFQAFVMEKA